MRAEISGRYPLAFYSTRSYNQSLVVKESGFREAASFKLYAHHLTFLSHLINTAMRFAGLRRFVPPAYRGAEQRNDGLESLQRFLRATGSGESECE